jgi:NAD(P)-dependent dehydrogenase (short-subunit alcohol dehydrogenase family)
MGDRLKGKVAFVTGGSSGIGEATARRFAREGARVALCGRREAEVQRVARLIEGEGGTVLPFTLDVGDLDGYAAALRQAAERLGRLDVLVNNAMFGGMGMIADLPLERWRQNFLINSDAVFIGTQQAFRIMIPQGSGSVVNVSSTCGIRALEGTAGYGASKAALIHFSAIAAMEGAHHGIRVNCVIPGGVDTPANRDSLQGDEELARARAAANPLGRIGEPDELANAILFLASDESSFVTGQALTVDGGSSIRLNSVSGRSSYFRGGSQPDQA